jgi:hypothetical protein
MELTRQQVATMHHLAEAFCHDPIQELDVRLPHDADGWALVNIIPYYFLVDKQGTIQHVSERSTPPPGHPNARRISGGDLPPPRY